MNEDFISHFIFGDSKNKRVTSCSIKRVKPEKFEWVSFFRRLFTEISLTWYRMKRVVKLGWLKPWSINVNEELKVIKTSLK